MLIFVSWSGRIQFITHNSKSITFPRLLNSSKHRFFIAVLPPEDIQDYVTEVKQVFAERYNSRAALKSPPHITLQPPFERLTEELPKLSRVLSEFAGQQPPVPITLSGFGAFVPRVVYVNVLKPLNYWPCSRL